MAYTCQSTDSNYCKGSTNCKCFKCGESVCKNCSLVVSYYHYGKKRLCHSCLEEEDGNDAQVIAHLANIGNWSPQDMAHLIVHYKEA